MKEFTLFIILLVVCTTRGSAISTIEGKPQRISHYDQPSTNHLQQKMEMETEASAKARLLSAQKTADRIETCVDSVATIITSITGLQGCFRIFVAIRMIIHAKRIISNCEKFKHLSLDKRCSNSIEDTSAYIHHNWSSFVQLSNYKEVKDAFSVLLQKLKLIPVSCVDK